MRDGQAILKHLAGNAIEYARERPRLLPGVLLNQIHKLAMQKSGYAQNRILL
jgi:hypothetical protein